jgi:hypothetical protein
MEQMFSRLAMPFACIAKIHLLEIVQRIEGGKTQSSDPKAFRPELNELLVLFGPS